MKMPTRAPIPKPTDKKVTFETAFFSGNGPGGAIGTVEPSGKRACSILPCCSDLELCRGATNVIGAGDRLMRFAESQREREL
jgi:hypothetical protein